MDVLDPYEYVMRNYSWQPSTVKTALKTLSGALGFMRIWICIAMEAIDWRDDMFGADVVSQQHNVSINGGSEKRYALSSTYNKDGGLMKTTVMSVSISAFKLNHEISDSLRFSERTRKRYRYRQVRNLREAPTNQDLPGRYQSQPAVWRSYHC